jgi:hypothetical protein
MAGISLMLFSTRAWNTESVNERKSVPTVNSATTQHELPCLETCFSELCVEYLLEASLYSFEEE